MSHSSHGELSPPRETTLETRGIDPVPDSERHGRVRELFPTWAAAKFWQVLIVGVCAATVSTAWSACCRWPGNGAAPRA